MDFLLKSKPYFDKDEKLYFDNDEPYFDNDEPYFDNDEIIYIYDFFLYMDEFDPNKIDIDLLVKKFDKNTITRKSFEKKLDTMIANYNLDKITGKILDKIKNQNFNVETKSKSKSKSKKLVKGGSAGAGRGGAVGAGRGGAELVRRLVFNIETHGIIKGSAITFVEIILIYLFVKLFFYILDKYAHKLRRYGDTLRDIFSLCIQKITAFYYNLRFLILDERTHIVEYREIINIPDNDVSSFSPFEEDAVLVPNNIDVRLRRHLNDLLGEYNRSQDYTIYSRLTPREQNELIRRINNSENELLNLSEPIEFTYMENVPNIFVSNDNFNDRYAIANPVIQPNNMNEENDRFYMLKNLFKNLLKFCFQSFNNNSRLGGRKKSQNKIMKTIRNKKRIARTKRNRRNSRSA
jgi:hypothetical protein